MTDASTWLSKRSAIYGYMANLEKYIIGAIKMHGSRLSSAAVKAARAQIAATKKKFEDYDEAMRVKKGKEAGAAAKVKASALTILCKKANF
jgi:hypothetical protein